MYIDWYFERLEQKNEIFFGLEEGVGLELREQVLKEEKGHMLVGWMQLSEVVIS